MTDPDAKPRVRWVDGPGRVTPDELADKIKRSPFPADVVMQKILHVALGNSQKRTPVRTGHLRRSLTTRMEDGGQRGYIGTNVTYAPFVHNGTKYMFSRPFIQEGIEDSRDQIVAILADAGDQFLADIGEI